MVPRYETQLRGRTCRLALAGLSLLLFVGMGTSALALKPGAESPLSTHELLPGIQGRIQPDGTLLIFSDMQRDPLLTARVPALVESRRSRLRGKGLEIVPARLSEGVPGGQRGFSAGADDDGDGAVDEDRRDGRDNDGDGLVDEDFAAISDDMTVVHRREAGASVHQEFYHWSYPGLRSAVFLSLDSDRGGLTALEVSARGNRWIETDLSSRHHSVTGRPEVHRNHAFVTRQEGDQKLWLAIMVLGDRPGYLALGGDNGNRLDFPLSDSPLPLVVCVASSWQQLARILTDAEMVFNGVSDPLNKRTAGWIVPAPCSLCRTSGTPAFSLEKEGSASLVVKMHLQAGQSPLVDPDLFVLSGRALGVPGEITWRPAAGGSQTVPWSEVTLASLRNQASPPVTPYDQLETLSGHTSEGVLEFRFPDAQAENEESGGSLAGVWLDGRPFRSAVMAPGKPSFEEISPVLASPGVPSTPDNPADTRKSLDGGKQPPALSPELLEGWPNPFRDAISIKFKVPDTVGEAFHWVDEGDMPKNLDAQAAVPWNGGNPSASIKIYNINGQELVTLYDGSVSQGEFTVNWNGTDIFGRQVASGTYFCKFQLDDWSVTRSIVYLR
jgi:hypothetical protein